MTRVLYLLFAVVIFYGIYNASRKQVHINTHIKKEDNCTLCTQRRQVKISVLQQELSRIDTPEYILRYIVDVIDHGSDTLGFRGGVMEGGYVSHEDAAMIACYVLELSGRKCPHPYPEDAQMFYTSVCGGCHGNDGKGLGGNYPDLTRRKLLGIARRESYLKSQLSKLQ